MGRNRKTDREANNNLNAIKENSKTIAENSQIVVENTARTNEKLDDMKNGIDAIKGSGEKIEENTERINEKLDDVRKNTASKLPVAIAIIGVLVTIIVSIVDNVADRKTADVTSESEVEYGTEVEPETEPETEYKIYLYPEYSKFNIGFEVDMTASLNFEADSVSITAHLASGGEDTLELNRKNAMEWQKKVEFDEVGVHEIVVSATAPNGEVAENSVEVEVTPISIDMDAINQLFSP